MALQQTIILKDSFGDDKTFQNTYRKVTNYTGTKEQIFVVVSTYKNKELMQLISADGFSFKPQMNNENFIKQAYEYLKTLPEFVNTQDC